jgi:hypothetical protein
VQKAVIAWYVTEEEMGLLLSVGEESLYNAVVREIE